MLAQCNTDFFIFIIKLLFIKDRLIKSDSKDIYKIFLRKIFLKFVLKMLFF